MLPSVGMAYLCLRPIAILLAFLLFNTCVTDEETPRKRVDLQDKFWFHFVTRPDIQAPKFHVSIFDEKAISPGYWFISPYQNIHKKKRGKDWEGPYIYDGNGDLVWAGSPTMDYFNLHDFRVATFNNTDMLTGISQRDNGGLFFNSNYELVKTVSWTSDWKWANMHEFNVIENGSRALAATRHRHTELSLETSRTVGFEGRCKVRADGIKEIDITVDPPRILFEWVGIDHIPLSESVKFPEKTNDKCSGNWDIHHFNSIDKFADGDYLVSSRELDTIYKVSHIDGSIVWRLGGKQSDFRFLSHAKFGAQHFARIIEETATHLKLSVFSNAGGRPFSRGIVVVLQTREKTVELVQEAAHPLKTHTGSRGSNQLLPSGNLFVCWAGYTRLSEHDPSGKLLMHAYLKREKNTGSYRAYKFPWVGRPKKPPNVYSAAFALGTDRNRIMTRTFVSWNGATEVASWKLYESNADGTDLKRINETTRRGFETDITYEGYAEHVVVEALDSRNQPIGRSQVVQTIPPVEGAPELNQTIVVSYATGDFDKSWILPIFTNPISTYVAGFVTCAAMWAGIWIVGRLKKRPWWRRKGAKYEPVESKDQEHLFGVGEEEEAEDDVELRDQKCT